MKRAICVIVCLMFLVGVASAQNKTTHKQLKDRIRQLEQRLNTLEREVDSMVQATIPGDLDVYMDENDPTDPGDIKVVRGTLLELDDCDSIAAWSVHSGVGVTIALNNSTVYEGTGSIRVAIPAGITGIIKCTGAWDISTYKYLKVSLYNDSGLSIPNCNIHFGEAAYGEQNMGVFTLSNAPGGWVQKSWDISAIAEANKNGVTLFALTIPNASAFYYYIYIDYVFADPGPSSIRAFDSDRIINLYPKILTDHYHATGAQLVITLARKGIPSGVLFFPLTDAKDAMAWQTEFGTSVKNLATSATVANVIAVADGSITIEANANINVNTQIVSYIVMWDD